MRLHPGHNYVITSYGYTGGPTFKTLTEARKELSLMKKEDRIACKQHFGVAKVYSDKDGFVIKAGMNLWSASSISKY